MSDAPGSVRIAQLGGFTVSIEGASAAQRWRLRKAKTIVKLLALRSGHRVHRDVLVDQLWPDADPGVGTNNLHQALHAARTIVGSANLVLQDDVVVLGGSSATVTVDVDEFEAAAAVAAATGAVEDLRLAPTSWTGELLPEDLYEDWVAPHRDRLGGSRTRLVIDLGRGLTADGRAEEAVAVVEPMAAERPLTRTCTSHCGSPSPRLGAAVLSCRTCPCRAGRCGEGHVPVDRVEQDADPLRSERRASGRRSIVSWGCDRRVWGTSADMNDGPVTITPLENGPYLVKGPVTVMDADGSEYHVERSTIALCRCGGSTNKPFCDGTHSKIGFAAAERAVQAADDEPHAAD